MNSIEEQVKKIIAEHLDVSENLVTPSALLVDDLGADSIDAMDLLMAINEEFNVNIAPEAMDRVFSVHDLANLLRETLAKN